MLYPKIKGWIINHLLNSTVLVLIKICFIVYCISFTCFFYVAGVSTKCLYIDYFTFECKIHALIPLYGQSCFFFVMNFVKIFYMHFFSIMVHLFGCLSNFHCDKYSDIYLINDNAATGLLFYLHLHL